MRGSVLGASSEPAALALIGAAFRRAREAAGLNVRDAATAAGTSPRVVSHAEHGKPVSAVSFLRLCRLHDVDPFALLDAIAMHAREGAFHKRAAQGVSRGTGGETRGAATASTMAAGEARA